MTLYICEVFFKLSWGPQTGRLYSCLCLLWLWWSLLVFSGWISSFSTWRRPASGWAGLTLTRRGFEPTPRWSSSRLSSPSTASPRTPPPRRRAWARGTRCEGNEQEGGGFTRNFTGFDEQNGSAGLVSAPQSSDCTDIENKASNSSRCGRAYTRTI